MIWPSILAMSAVLAIQAAPGPDTAVDLFEDACVDTGMEHPALMSLAESRGWLRYDHEPSPDAGPRDWGIAYGGDAVQVLLMGADATERMPASVGATVYPAFRNCTLAVVGPADGWREAMAALADRLDFSDSPSDAPPEIKAAPGGEAREWRRRDGFVGWSYDPVERVLRMEIYRSLDPRFRFRERRL